MLKVYVSPLALEYCSTVAIPMYLEPPSHGNHVELTQDMLLQYPGRKFYLETRSKEELEEECRNVQSRITEFHLDSANFTSR